MVDVTAAAAPDQDQPPQTPQIEADASDTDSALGEVGSISSTTSINSSILKYREENGRTYHAFKDGKYVGPNDSTEQDRLDLQHHLFLLTFDNQQDKRPFSGGDS
jgi:hypothetical protein